jgi:predicted RNA binding protein YcfA (HicA-like mRNA interferase family)
MSKKDKLLRRILDNPTNVRFQELQKLLDQYGFILERVTGDHYIYKKPGFRPISVPFTHPVKSYVVREVIKIIRNFIDPEDE